MTRTWRNSTGHDDGLLFPLRAAALGFALGLFAFCGCATSGNEVAGLKDSLVGLRNSVEEVSKTVGDVSAQVANVDQSTNNYDAWALRLQAVGPWLLLGLPFPYVFGKLVWKTAGKAGAVVRRR